jgi:hypothetical protein
MIQKIPTVINIVDKPFVEKKLKDLFKNDLTDLVTWKFRWKKIGNVTLASAKLLVASALVFDFIAGFYKNPDFTFLAGCSNTVALALMSYSAYSFGESKKRNNNLVKLLKNANIDTTTKFIEVESTTTTTEEEMKLLAS